MFNNFIIALHQLSINVQEKMLQVNVIQIRGLDFIELVIGRRVRNIALECHQHSPGLVLHIIFQADLKLHALDLRQSSHLMVLIVLAFDKDYFYEIQN